ncbi:MAG TPA: bifunctional UDP-N-acetylglucosamine diphosphorylase/glucosamine-1-phosphate N-acetyltransferase GlmU [Anaerolineae bacterium]
MKLAAVILAAGQGTRMKSNLPKVMHRVAGKPMVQYALESVRALGIDQPVLVVGHGADQVRAAVDQAARFAEQTEPRGTGHAVLQARDLLRGKADSVLVTYADMPLLRGKTLQRLIDLHASARATITMLTVRSEDTMGFGRILRNTRQRVRGIVEESDATPAQLAIRELNCGIYCFDARWMWARLAKLKPSGSKREYYLTDLVAMAVKERRKIESIMLDDVSEVIGVNTRVHLARAEKIARERINRALMEAGVTLIDPATAYIDAEVEIAADTIIEPNTHLKGKTRVGANCRIGPNAILRDAIIGDECEIVASVIRESILEEHVHVGPFADLRPGTHLARNVYIGNYGEVKNSYVGEDTHIGHFSYIGDAQLGARVNIGAGTITANYDGTRKNRTVIGDDAFIGSDTMLVAPVKIGARAHTGAGSVVTKDVPDDSLAVGAPARVIRKLNSGKAAQ